MTSIVSARPARVLIIDDSPPVRQLLRQCLSLSGRFEVIGEAGDGRDGIAQATCQQPDIILLDLAMPVMDGLEALPHLARCSTRSMIIVLSGFNVDTTGPKVLALGASAYIEKRFGPDELVCRIEHAWDAGG
jgi:DNA-binding NarL/FixJ family response regulator